MAKIQEVKPVKVAKVANGLTAATFSSNGKKGKPARPDGMSNAEWSKVIANIRMPRAIKNLEAVARLTTIVSDGDNVSEFSEKQYRKMLSDIKTRVDIIEQAFETAISNIGKAQKKGIKISKVQAKYFS